VVKELRELARVAVSQGWRVERTGKHHLRWVPPEKAGKTGRVIYSGSTLSDYRAIRNIRAMLRREGLRV